MTRRVVVDPRLNPHYHSYFIDGFRRLGFDIQFDARSFPSATGFPRMGMRAIVIDQAVERRMYLAADDMTVVDVAGLAWCDVYGAVNLRWIDVPDEGREKVVPLGPAFGLRAWSAAQSTLLAVRTVRAALEVRRVREQVRLWRDQARRRLPIDRYEPVASDADYVFFTGWLWKKHEDVNPPRARFLEACRSIDGLDVEGGFPPRRRGDVSGYEEQTAPRKYSLAEYIEKTQRSAVAFASPAVHGCLGWKLGEFLALGKAIVMTPYDRALPAPLEHGNHVHIVEDDIDSMRDAVRVIATDHDHRRALERGARQWFDEWSSPTAMATRLLER